MVAEQFPWEAWTLGVGLFLVWWYLVRLWLVATLSVRLRAAISRPVKESSP